MDFHVVLVLSLGILVIGSAAVPAFDEFAGEDESLEGQPEEEASVVSYKRTVVDGDEVYEEEFKIDKENQIEEIRVQAHGNSDAADIIRDFKRNLAMYRVPDKKICLLGPLDGREMSPSALAAELESEIQSQQPERATIGTKWHVVSTVADRSVLSDEMAFLCAKYPIYRIEKDREVSAIKVFRGRVKRRSSETETKTTVIMEGVNIKAPGVDIIIDKVVVKRKSNNNYNYNNNYN